jgi:FAD/FMN-containing dehydrogenase
MKLDDLVKKLNRIVGAAWVRTDDLTRYYYGADVATYLGQGAIYPENHPLLVVFPGSAKDVQGVVRLVQKHDIPLYAIGGGTVLLIGSIPAKPNVAITLDFHRMKKVEVDQDRMVVRVEPGATGLQVCQLIRDMDFGYRPFFGGSPGTCHFVPYQIFVGQNKLAGLQDGMGIHCATGMELVLPNGEILKTGSMSHPDAPAWPHGPGPAMTYLPFISNAGYGIVTAMEFRFFATPQKTSSLWVMFDTLEDAVKGIYEVMKIEYGCGITLMGRGCYVHCLYSSRHWQESVHFIKATKTDINLIGMAFRGTRGRVNFERNACIKALKKNGGTPLPDWMVAILDGHETNTTGWQQNNNMRSLGTFNGRFDSGGLFVTSGVFDTLDVLAVHMKQGLKDYQEVIASYPEYVDTPYTSFHLYTNCVQAYLIMGGHANSAGEFIFMADYARKDQLPMIGELNERFAKSMHKLGLAPLSLGRDKRTWTECPAHFEMAKLIKKVLDPKNVLAPGAAFPVDLFEKD